MPAKKKEMSLLPDYENPNSIFNRVLNWLTSVGRVVIIITELVVVAAFLSRFWLDRKNSDLGELLRQRKAILESTKEFEKSYNSLQQKLNFIKTYYKSDDKIINQLDTIAKSIPESVAVMSMNVVKTESGNQPISVSAYGYTQESIVDLIVNLSLNPEIKTVEINKIEKKTKNNKYEVNVNLILSQPNSTNGT